MHFLDLLCLRRIFNVLLIASLVLFLSCQSDPMTFDPLNGYEYQFHSFPLDIDSAESILVESNIGLSTRLYTGIINNHELISNRCTDVELIWDWYIYKKYSSFFGR